MIRFLRSVSPEPNSGCWLWLAAGNAHGYGKFCMGGATAVNGMTGAHRAAWMLFRGEIPDGLHVCHRCDVRACVNPGHLFLGTMADNMADMHRKGRGAYAPRAKLTPNQVRTIRARAGENQRLLGVEFGVGQTTISEIVRGVRWPEERLRTREASP